MKLVTPSIKYKESYIQMVKECSEQDKVLIPFILAEDYTDFVSMIDRLAAYARGEQMPSGYVAHSTFWLIDDNELVIGCSNLRHGLTDALLEMGGHIGYGIKPSERKKGYAKRILALTLEKAKAQGIDNALLTVNKTNLGSVKAIQFNNGALETEKEVKGQDALVQYYWIDV